MWIDVWGDERDTPFAAYTQGEDWNGFATPRFTKDVAMKVAEWTQTFDADFAEIVTWDDGQQALVGRDWHVTEDGYPPYVYDAIPSPHGPLYAIGAWSWTWNAE